MAKTVGAESNCTKLMTSTEALDIPVVGPLIQRLAEEWHLKTTGHRTLQGGKRVQKRGEKTFLGELSPSLPQLPLIGGRMLSHLGRKIVGKSGRAWSPQRPLKGNELIQ